MRFAYNIVFALFFWLSAPWYFLKLWRRGNWRPGFAQRFGFYSPAFKAQVGARPVLWLHAVSVGEVGVCLQFLRELEPALPSFQLIVSTTTSTGMGELKRKLPPHVPFFYYPVDFPGAVRRAFATIRPRAIVLVEAELWPNFLWHALDHNLPLFLVNARISERSFRNYRRFAFLFQPIFNRFRAVACQQAEDADRLKQLGFRPEAVHTTGNLKFDAAQPEARPVLDASALLRQIGVNSTNKIIVAGSTHAGEEPILARICARLRQSIPELFLVLVPRHFERAKEVGQELESLGVRFMFRGDIQPGAAIPPGQLECLIVNSTGELKSFYQTAAVVFVGKSLTARGGQNPIEPAALGKAMTFGPNMQNFIPITRAFLSAQAAIQAPDAAELERVLGELLVDDVRRAELGARARRVVEQNLGATARTVEIIKQSLFNEQAR